MTCTRYERDLALYVEHDLVDADVAAVEAHLGACPACRSFLASLRASQAWVKDLAAEEIDAEALAATRVADDRGRGARSAVAPSPMGVGLGGHRGRRRRPCRRRSRLVCPGLADRAAADRGPCRVRRERTAFDRVARGCAAGRRVPVRAVNASGSRGRISSCGTCSRAPRAGGIGSRRSSRPRPR